MTTVAPRPVLRNDPCPCGSGRRFKDCHGSLRGTASAPTPAATAAASADAQRSRYRPAGDDWAGLDADTSDRLGAMMELALKHQMEQRMRDAEGLYRAVLEKAPLTHDALHMLGVVRLGLGDFSDAERLLKSAMALRPSYPAIEQNWSLVQRSIAGRDHRGLEIVCEHALPLLRETLDTARRARRSETAPSPASGLHVVEPLDDSGSDAAWAARRVGELLAPLAPTLWRAPPPRAQPSAWSRVDRNLIDAATGRRPEGGAVVLAHIECDTDDWLRESIDRVLVLAQASLPSIYLERLRRIAADGGRSLTMMFTSRAKARKFGCDAIVVPPPIDLAEFAEAAARRETSGSTMLRVAAVGQDGRRVVAAEDMPLLKAIAAHAGTLTLLDPGPLRYHVGMLPAVHCIARSDRPIDWFLAGSDLYFHRERPWWTEDAGHVFFGAMALGVPVLCHRQSIYAEYIDDGVDGWLFGDDASALAVIDVLRAHPSRISAAGRAAHAKAQRLFEPRALAGAYVDAVTQWLRG
jgi:glycosyltransferase involved in cell wall biosynthesis